MTTPTVYLDMTRRLKRGTRAVTGLDRWDVAAAELLSAHGPRVVPVLQTRWGLRQLPPAATALAGTGAARLLPATARLWPAARGPGLWLNLSHQGLEAPGLWAASEAAGLSPVIYLHDLIPLTHPSTTRPEQPARHSERLRRSVMGAAALLCPSHAVAAALRDWADTERLILPPLHLLPPGLPDWANPAPVQPDTVRPTVVMLGTFEPRKGHDLLPGLWAGWDDAPDLLLLGHPGYRGDAILRALRSSPALAGRLSVHLSPDDPTVCRSLAAARALILPSRAEGWGLPIAEALAMGTPVVCTDLPAHAESGGGLAGRLPLPDNDAAIGLWRAALSDLCDSEKPIRIPGAPARSWNDAMADLAAMLASL